MSYMALRAVNWTITMSTTGDEHVETGGAETAEITELRTKLALLIEIQAVQSNIQQPALVATVAVDPQRTQPVMRTKVPEGSYTMNVAIKRMLRLIRTSQSSLIDKLYYKYASAWMLTLKELLTLITLNGIL